MQRPQHIALLGNPNSGKSSLFNALTGLNQKVGNFPGVTIEKKSGTAVLPGNKKITVFDLPGSYSLYPRRADEWVAYRALLHPEQDNIELLVVVADASSLRRNLLYVSQLMDLGKPIVLALTMVDMAKKRGIKVDNAALSNALGIPVISINPRTNKGIDKLKISIAEELEKTEPVLHKHFISLPSSAEAAVKNIRELFPTLSEYHAVHYLMNHESFGFDDAMQEQIENIEKNYGFNHTRIQAEEIQSRYSRIREIMHDSVKEVTNEERKRNTEKIDDILIHRVWGYFIMFAVLFLLFQSVFLLAEYPMTGIEWVFAELSTWLTNILPASWFSDLLVNGVIAGLGGIIVFVPQIMILFGLITLLEDTGYMARISFLSDKIMRKAGLNGKSVMPMISAFACAVPAIMSARNIENRKERLLTILVTPFMSCSARLPVYTILIALVIPKKLIWGIISMQGVVMMGLYLLGILMALAVASVLKWIIKIKEKSFFILELPLYRPPRWKNIGISMVEKAKIFVLEAGKVIMIISLILWLLSSYGPGDKREEIKKEYAAKIKSNPAEAESLESEMNAGLLEHSYAGILGHAIEPAIKPLGYDWKIGIALITSFAAREVFVGTMATLYSVGGDADEENPTLRKKMNAAVKEDGSKVYTLGTGVSLMIFYLLAMQCMSTMAIVRRETGSWKWPLIQFAFMTVLAYVCSLIAYQVLK
ncbi:ferrous iron transport protein B [Pollutibacter soli]|uniref:ferrous iron transport protein B n=1 Tax=Pollutibacter soli TaxID=3034157 RepID=UPI0030133DB1